MSGRARCEQKAAKPPRCTSEAGLVAAYTPIPIHGLQTLTPALIEPPQVTSSSLCYFGNSSYLAHRFPELQKTTLTGFLLLPHVPLSGAYLFEDLPGTRMRRDARRGEPIGAHNGRLVRGPISRSESITPLNAQRACLFEPPLATIGTFVLLWPEMHCKRFVLPRLLAGGYTANSVQDTPRKSPENSPLFPLETFRCPGPLPRATLQFPNNMTRTCDAGIVARPCGVTIDFLSPYTRRETFELTQYLPL